MSGGVQTTALERAALLSRLRAADSERARRAEPQPVPDPPSTAPAAAFDFSRLPDYKQLRLQRAAADVMKIDNPFFRSHEGLAAGTTSVGGRTLINFSSYNYLGLNGHPEVIAAAKAAIDRYGVSASASRLVAGERDIHGLLERRLASLHGTESAVVMVSGHATNVTTIGTLMGPKDLVLIDALIHNSVAEGVRLSGARRMSFAHNDWRAADEMLRLARHQYERVLIVVEGLYSMDGDAPDLAAFVDLKQRYDAWLMVDEAHAVGVLGRTGRGIAEAQGVDPGAVEIWMGTLSKTLSGCGGYIAGSSALTEYLKVKAGGFVYSVGLPPAVAAAAIASIDIMEREPDRVDRLRSNGRLLLQEAQRQGLDTGTSLGHAIVPVITADSLVAVKLSDRLFKRGFNVLPIIFPAVPEKSARLRFFVTSENTEDQIRAAMAATAEELEGVTGAAAS